MRDTLVILPTFNEAGNIREMLHALMAGTAGVDVLVVDDGSPDGTADLVDSVQGVYPGRIFLERRRGPRGLGRAYLHGFRWALRREYAFVIEMDADFSHAPADVARLRAAAEDADVVVGSRYVPGGGIKDWTWDRLLLSRLASRYVRLVLGWSVRDATAGFMCYRRRALLALDLEKVRFVGYAFQIEMKYSLIRRGFVLREIPILFTDRVRGVSKMNLSILHEAGWGVWWMKCRL